MTLRLREQSAQLEKEKLQLADAMADISHQMRTPLTAVNLLLTELSAGRSAGEESRGDVRALRRQVARMDWLVESLLKLAKLDAGTARLLPGNHCAFGPAGAGGASRLPSGMDAARPAAAGRGFRERPSVIPQWTAEALGNILKNCSEHMEKGTHHGRGRRKTPCASVVCHPR